MVKIGNILKPKSKNDLNGLIKNMTGNQFLYDFSGKSIKEFDISLSKRIRYFFVKEFGAIYKKWYWITWVSWMVSYVLADIIPYTSDLYFLTVIKYVVCSLVMIWMIALGFGLGYSMSYAKYTDKQLKEKLEEARRVMNYHMHEFINDNDRRDIGEYFLPVRPPTDRYGGAVDRYGDLPHPDINDGYAESAQDF